MSRSADRLVLAVSGLIAATVASGAARALVREPVWLLCSVLLVLCGIVIFRCARRHTSARLRDACFFFAAGCAAGLTVPTIPPPPMRITTHAIGGFSRLDKSADLLRALQALDDDPQGVLGRRIAVRGTWSPQASQPASVSVRIMTCCAADAVDAGFDVVPQSRVSFAAGAPVRVVGVVHAVMHDGELRYDLDQAVVSGDATQRDR